MKKLFVGIVVLMLVLIGFMGCTEQDEKPEDETSPEARQFIPLSNSNINVTFEELNLSSLILSDGGVLQGTWENRTASMNFTVENKTNTTRMIVFEITLFDGWPGNSIYEYYMADIWIYDDTMAKSLLEYIYWGDDEGVDYKFRDNVDFQLNPFQIKNFTLKYSFARDNPYSLDNIYESYAVAPGTYLDGQEYWMPLFIYDGESWVAPNFKIIT